MKYSSKQKLAMAMAATMVVAVVPQMAFAASDVDMVLEKLNSKTGNPAGLEDEAQVKAGDLTTAKQAYEAAEKLAVTDAQALQLIKTYKASYNVLNSKTEKEFNDNMNIYKTELGLLAAGLKAGFVSKATVDKHESVKTKLATPSGITVVNATLTDLGVAGMSTLAGELKGAATPADYTVVFLKSDVEQEKEAVKADGKFEVDVKASMIEGFTAEYAYKVVETATNKVVVDKTVIDF